MRPQYSTLLFFYLIVTTLLLNSNIIACTDARVIAKDGSVVTARSMEFGAIMNSRLVIKPQGSVFISPAPGNTAGFTWISKYGIVYLDGFDIDCAVDGMNEAGLGFGALYLPGFAEYENIEPVRNKYAVSNLQFGAWALSQYSNVEEVKAALPGINVWGEPVAVFGNDFVPLHFVIHDAAGTSIVIEWVNGKLTVYDNTAGVMTNSPPYDWHMTNLRNYISLSPDNSNPVKVGGITYPSNGQGSGLFGMPGDPTPPSRLIQTVFALNSAVTPLNATEALILAQKLMNRVDLPEGLARDKSSGESDITQWAVFRDQTNKIYYFRTYDDMTLNAVDLKKISLTAGSPDRRMPVTSNAPTVKWIDQNNIPVFTK
ncbi:MAG TPA: choloylglycine hydrolase family protein [Ignavibacteria bacterium]|nr:choloylglycine hydrolase family protein [Ignavibacteria bacterium]